MFTNPTHSTRPSPPYLSPPQMVKVRLPKINPLKSVVFWQTLDNPPPQTHTHTQHMTRSTFFCQKKVLFFAKKSTSFCKKKYFFLQKKVLIFSDKNTFHAVQCITMRAPKPPPRLSGLLSSPIKQMTPQTTRVPSPPSQWKKSTLPLLHLQKKVH